MTCPKVPGGRQNKGDAGHVYYHYGSAGSGGLMTDHSSCLQRPQAALQFDDPLTNVAGKQ